MWSTSRIWPWAFTAPLAHNDIVKASIILFYMLLISIFIAQGKTTIV